MPISSHLLERAYQLIDANQIDNAKLVLDAVVRVEPENVETWKTYLQICEDRSDLEWLRQRILRTTDLNDQDRDDILEYQSYLIQQLGQSKKMMGIAKPTYYDHVKREDEGYFQGGKVLFELIDVFDYSITKNKKNVRRRLDRRWFDRRMSDRRRSDRRVSDQRWLDQRWPDRRKFDRRRADQRWTDRRKFDRRRSDRKFAYKFTPASGFALALPALFYFSVRLLVLGYFLGYLLLAMFMAGGVIWLRNFGNRTKVQYVKPARAFMLRTKNTPLVIKTGMKAVTESNKTRPGQENHKLA